MPSTEDFMRASVQHEGPARSIHDVTAPANPLYVDRNRTRVTIDFEGLLTLREVYEHLASLRTLTDQLVIIDYRKTEDYC